jgi:tetratricopeptide (TPR) repeat protein
VGALTLKGSACLTVAGTFILALLASCADPGPAPSPAAELNERIDAVREEVSANESWLGSGRPEDQVPQLETTLSRVAARYGERSVASVQALTETGVLLIRVTGRYDLALPYIQRSLALHRVVYGNEHRETAYALHDLALVYAGLGLSKHGSEAEAALREALRIRRSLLGDEHKETAGAKAELARQLLSRWREADPAGPDLAEVEELASSARRVLEPSRGSSDSEIVDLRRTLLECAFVRKDFALAEKRAQEAIELLDGAPSSGLFPNSSASDLLTRIRAAQTG